MFAGAEPELPTWLPELWVEMGGSTVSGEKTSGEGG